MSRRLGARSFVGGWVALALAAVIAGQARAQTGGAAPAPPGRAISDADMEEARRHFRQGMALFEDRDYNGALAEFETAFKLSREPVALYQTGLTLRASFRYAEAIETLERYLTHTAMDSRVTADQRKTVESTIAEMKSLTAEVTIAANPAAATITVDGRPARLAKGRVLLAAGDHVIEASAEGFQALRKEIRVVAGVPQKVDLALQPVPRHGKVSIRSNTPATLVRIDGEDKGVAPVDVVLLAGGHQLEASARGYQTWRTDVNVAANQTRVIDIQLEPERVAAAAGPPIYKKWWFWTATAAAAALLTGGAVVAASSGGGREAPLRGTLSPGVNPVDP